MIKSVLAIIAKSFQSITTHLLRLFASAFIPSYNFYTNGAIVHYSWQKAQFAQQDFKLLLSSSSHHRRKNKNKWENLFTSSNIVPVLVTLTKKSNLKKVWKNLDQLGCLLRNNSRSMYNCNNSTKRKIHHSYRL